MGYGMITEIGNHIIDILCREMVPDVIQHESNIGMCSPEEHGDYNLGLYLYDISESEEIQSAGMVNAGLHAQSYPSTYLNLYYMITAYSASDLKFRAAEEQRILGKTIQVLRDYGVLSAELLGEGVNGTARIDLQRMENYEKMRMWNFPNIPYKLSLFYKVGPVEIASSKTREITRVRAIDFTVKEQ